MSVVNEKSSDVAVVERHEDIAVTQDGSVLEDHVDPAVDKRLRWKLDLIILPLVGTIYFLASMSRSDLANAKSAGMAKDLHLTAHQYSNLATAFLIGYIAFQLPGTIFIRKIRAPFQFAFALVGWGTCVALCAVCKNYSQLFAVRFLIGGFEAFVQGVVFYLSFWYTYDELVLRGAIFFATSSLAGAFNGLIAYGVLIDMNGRNGLKAWQWLYIIEGVLSIGFGFIVLFILPATPESSPKWLFSELEVRAAVLRSRRSHNAVDSKLRWRLLYTPLLEVKFWLLAAMYAGSHYAVASLSNFLPSIIIGFGYSIVKSQLMTVIVYACALVAVLTFGYLADRMRTRGIFVIICSVLGGIGYILLLVLHGSGARLAATCILIMGIFPTIPLILTWTTVNLAGYTKRGASLALVNIVSQLFAISGTQAYHDPPLYRKGNASALGLVAFMGICAVVLSWYLRFLNKKKAAFRDSLTAEELDALRRSQSLDIVGDGHVDFVYGY
ncbi:hypothetical protein ANO11243_092220 [Dothideomycetidae sp. 11243]|nr:hypothetical protein ANO11243_092220 [fungal sp. No.11243]